MADSANNVTPAPVRQPKPEKPEIGEQVGRTLGKAFLKLKQSRVWKETKKNYEDNIREPR